MTIEQIEKIDIVSTNVEDGSAILTISDHLEWDVKNEKFVTLQAKLNSYLEFIESGQILEECPTAKEKAVLISLVCKYKPSEAGENFLSLVANALSDYNVVFEWNCRDEN